MDPRAFFAIMGILPTGVTVVTTLDGRGEPHGFTASALCSVSADPPLLLVCINRRSRTLDAICASGRFVVNFLGGDRAEVSRRFASSGENRFATTAWRASGNGMPHLYRDSVAHADCRTEQVVEAGDHLIVVASVTDGQPPSSGARPLMYFRRQYQAWPAGSAEDRAPPVDVDETGIGQAADLLNACRSSAHSIRPLTRPRG
ncbi:MAG: flavin reductase family protein [Haloechinothrix sp.]